MGPAICELTKAPPWGTGALTDESRIGIALDSWRPTFGVQEVTEVPLPEIVVIGSHLRASHLHTYLNLAPLRDLGDSTTAPPGPVDETGRSAQSSCTG